MRYERSWLERAIETTRQHRGVARYNHCPLPAIANAFADEIEGLWDELKQLREGAQVADPAYDEPPCLPFVAGCCDRDLSLVGVEPT